MNTGIVGKDEVTHLRPDIVDFRIVQLFMPVMSILLSWCPISPSIALLIIFFSWSDIRVHLLATSGKILHPLQVLDH